MQKQTAPLWLPSESQVKQTRLADYQAWLAREWLSEEWPSDTHQCTFTNYNQLHAWSVQEAPSFWESIWDYFNVIGDRGSKPVENIDAMPGARWFPQAKLNFSENLLRFGLDSDTKSQQPAIVVCNESGRQAQLSFAELRAQVAYLANFLKNLGVAKGDRVAAMSTNSEHAIVGMLATASLGAVWSSCSPDFGESGILDRFAQIEPAVFIACTEYLYAGKRIDCTDKVLAVTNQLPSLNACVLFNPLDRDELAGIQEKSGTFTHWTSVIPNEASQQTDVPALEFTQVGFNDPLYILFSSGTTGKPKCIVHGVGGTLLQHLKELALHTDVKEGTKLFYFTTCGWMMWNWYVSGLALGATLIAYDGSPFHEEQSALFDLAEREQIEVFGASAKYFSAAEKFGLKPAQTHDLSSLKSILSTGSPLVPESFDYLYRDVAPNVRVSSISGGTDIVSCFALGAPTLPVYRGELQCKGLGMDISFVDDDGQPLPQGKGELVCSTSFPSMPIFFWGDENGSRYQSAYFERHVNRWAHGDYGEEFAHSLSGFEHNGVMIYGRSDAVLNPNGVRIGTAELYRQVEKVPQVFESIAIGQRWDGDERIVLFVRLQDGQVLEDELIATIKRTIRENTTPRHVPAKIIAVSDIPRTRSGKIVELAVRAVVHGEAVKNTEAIANPEALDLFKDLPELNC